MPDPPSARTRAATGIIGNRGNKGNKGGTGGRTLALYHPHMENRMNDWIFEHDLDPILLHLGPVNIGWYGLMYLISFFGAYWYYLRESRRPGSPLKLDDVPNMLFYGVLGVMLGGRLGWVLFYGIQNDIGYLTQPWRILEVWKGGMSFHGGLLGVTLAIVLYARGVKIPILSLGDFVVPWVPVGMVMVRIGNFINGELFGGPTDGSWGVKFYSDRLCRDAAGLFAPESPFCPARHPSQLYEAFLEGVVVLTVLMLIRRRIRRPGIQPATFLLLYGCARLAVEFVRLPDADIGYLAFGFVTMGQVLSLPMILAGAGWLAYLFTRPPAVARGGG